MAAPLDINREEVRMLVLELGYAETARRTGLNENTVRQWGNRYGWLDHLKQPQKLPASVTPTVVTGVTKPADALQNALAEYGETTKIAALKYAAKTTTHAARIAEEQPEKALLMAQDVKSVVQTAAIAGSWAAATGTQVNIAMLIGSREDHE